MLTALLRLNPFVFSLSEAHTKNIIMKKITSAAVTAMALATVCLIASCKKDNTTNPTNQTVLQAYISSDTSLTYFNAAIVRANDAQLFGGTDSITVLAPTNSAFIAAGISLSAINALPVSTLDSLIRYYIVPSSVTLSTGMYTSYNSLLGLPVYGVGAADGITSYFNGTIAFKETLPPGNAALYELNIPLIPPAASLNQLLATDTTLTLLAEALQRTNLGASLGTSSWNTLLAPDNNAFRNAGYADIAAIDNADVNTLTNIIQYHILTGEYFTNNFDQASVSSFEGETIAVTNTNGIPVFTGNNNTGAAAITIANELAGSNIIVQKIDHVLLP
jgi:uncharacterized surface protein with fasciclin (FAS1) repeats